MPNSPAAPSTGGPAWTVVSQKEATSMNAAGQLVAGVQIYFQVTDSGVQQSVFVPYPEYTPDRVREIINARVANIVAIHNLGG